MAIIHYENQSQKTQRPIKKKIQISWLLIVFLEAFSYLIYEGSEHQLFTYLQAEIVVVCFIAPHIKRSILTVLTVYFLYVLISDQLPVIYPQELAISEVILLGMVCYWLEKRPNIPSYPRSETVQLGFYYGDKSPNIAKIPAYLAYPVYGVAAIIGDRAMTTRKGKIICRSRESLNRTKWIFIDTQIEVTNELNQAFEALEGNKVEYAGCMKALSPFLELLGDYAPTVWNPAGYLEQALSIH